MTMYAQLKDNKSASSTENFSPAAEANEENNKLLNNKRIRKNTNPELSESLIDVTSDTTNVDPNDIEAGKEAIGCGIDDPFYVFKEDLLRKLVLMDDELNRYLHVVKTMVSMCVPRNDFSVVNFSVPIVSQFGVCVFLCLYTFYNIYKCVFLYVRTVCTMYVHMFVRMCLIGYFQ